MMNPFHNDETMVLLFCSGLCALTRQGPSTRLDALGRFPVYPEKSG